MHIDQFGQTVNINTQQSSDKYFAAQSINSTPMVIAPEPCNQLRRQQTIQPIASLQLSSYSSYSHSTQSL